MEIQENPLPEKESIRVGGHSGPPVTGSKTRSNSNLSARFKEDDQCYVEVTLDVCDDDSFVLRNIRAADEPGSTSARLEGRPSLASQLSFKLKKVSHELKRMKSSLSFKMVDRPAKPGVARALKGLKFMTKNVCSEGWPEIEMRFDELAVDGTLPKSVFAQCIGMKESSEFACEVFDALARRRGITSCCVTKEELREFWEQISDHSFNARLQTFFDMVDKNADGRISEEEVKEIITLSASANNLPKILEQAEEYAALIMEELDHDNLGYIDTYVLKVDAYCNACVKRVNEILKTIEGVYITQVDFAHHTVTVHGNVEVATLIKGLAKKTKKDVKVLWPERKANPKEVRLSKPKSNEEHSGSVETSEEAKENQGGGDEKRKGKQPIKAEVVEVKESGSTRKNNFEAGSCSYRLKIEEEAQTSNLPGQLPPVVAEKQSGVAESEVVGEKAGGGDGNSNGSGGVGGSANENLHLMEQQPYFTPVHGLHYHAALPNSSYAQESAYCETPTYAHWGLGSEHGWTHNLDHLPPSLLVQPPQLYPPPPHSYSSSISTDTFSFFSDENPNGCSVM